MKINKNKKKEKRRNEKKRKGLKQTKRMNKYFSI
jgi:hypothetical protein